jgi:hypothetical protein
MTSDDWSTVVEWNASMERREERETVPRDYLWASELSKAPIDVFLRMRGIKETNPPNGRSKRKFEVGIYMEWLVSLVYARAGILKEQQLRVEHQYEGLLKVSGKLDFLVGGERDFSLWEKMEAGLHALPFPPPDFIFRVSEDIKRFLEEEYPEGLPEKIVEIKSSSERMFDLMEKKGWKGQSGHRKQLYHYLKGKQMPRGDLIYIDKDSIRMAEVPIVLDGDVEKEYHDTIEIFTKYYNAEKDTPIEEFIEKVIEEGLNSWKYNWREGLPPREQLVIFSDDLGKFSKNFNVEYSGYLTPLYGFRQPSEYDEAFKPLISRWNRVLTRCKKGVKMTIKNLEVLDEIREHGFDLEAILASFVEDNEEENTSE